MFQGLLVIIYLAFISLGLPDSVLGAAWPAMYTAFDVPLAFEGILSAIMAGGTIISAALSERLTLRLGPGKVTAISVAMTAAALLGFSISNSFWLLCLWAIPYGLGAGSVDAALNNYVALHYESRHMSWLHCMWGIGTSIGPYIMSLALTGGHTWHMGYRIIGIMQIFLTAALFISLPKWHSAPGAIPAQGEEKRKPMPLLQVIRIKGAMEVFVCFFCYCAIESTVGLWASTYMNLYKGVSAETAAGYGALFFVGITGGRFISGFVTRKLSDKQMIFCGQALILLGILIVLLPLGEWMTLAGLVIMGLGCAPIYPCLIHSTPAHFGADKSQAVIGMQMAFAYVGSMGMPPLFGIIANLLNVSLMPWYLLILLVLMVFMHLRLERVTSAASV